jgi:hypothetical protein
MVPSCSRIAVSLLEIFPYHLQGFVFKVVEKKKVQISFCFPTIRKRDGWDVILNDKFCPKIRTAITENLLE